MGKFGKTFKGKSPKDTCLIEGKDILMVMYLTSRFKCLNEGTIRNKSNFLAKIVIDAKIDILFPKIKWTNEEKREFIRKKGARLFSGTLNKKQRLKNMREKNPYYFKKQKLLVDEFIKLNDEKISNFVGLEDIKFWENIIQNDYVKNQYVTAFNRQVYSFDTTQFAKRVYASILLDNSSRRICAYTLTNDTPTSQDLIEMFKEFFTQELKERCFIIHLDRAGCNLSKRICEYITSDIKAQISYTIGKCSNQLIEGTNKYLKSMLNARKLKDIRSDFTFEFLPHEKQIEILHNIIQEFNNINTKKSSYLTGFSRNNVDDAKEFLRNVIPEVIDKKFIIAKSESKYGKYLIGWNKCVVKLYNLIQLQYILYKNYDINFSYVNEKDLIKLQDLVCTEKNDIFTSMEEKIEKKTKILDFLISQIRQYQVEGLALKEIKEKVINLLIETLTDVENITDRFEIQYEINKLISETREIQGYKILLNEKDIKLDNLVEENEKLKENFNELIEKKKGKKEKNKILLGRRKINQHNNTDEDQSIMPEDFPTIIAYLNVICKQEFSKNRFKLLHIFLYLTGARISSVYFLTFQEIENLIEKRIMHVRIVKTNKQGTQESEDSEEDIAGTENQPRYVEFSYVPGMEPWVSEMKDLFIYFKQKQVEMNKKLFEPNPNHKQEEKRIRTSEIFGDMNKSRLITEVNTQLRKIGSEMGKILKSHSYRKGFIKRATIIHGINAARNLVGHDKISSTLQYLTDVPSRKEIKRQLSEIFNIKHSKDLPIAKELKVEYSLSESERKCLNQEINLKKLNRKRKKARTIRRKKNNNDN